MAHVQHRLHGDWTWIAIGIAVLTLLLLIVAGLFAYDSRIGGPLDPQTVRLSAVGWSLAGVPLTNGQGLTFHAGSSLTVRLAFTCSICGTVSLTSATTNTTGFAVTSSNFPLVIPAGETGNISVTVSTPRLGYSGVLAIDLN